MCDPKPDPTLEWRKQVFPELLNTIVEHDAILRSWIRFLIGIETAVILAIWALASSSRLPALAFGILVVIIGIFGSWMALQLIGIIGRVRQWNNWFIEVARRMQKDGGVDVFPLSDGQQQTTTDASAKRPVKLLKWIVEIAICVSLLLFNGLRLATNQNAETDVKAAGSGDPPRQSTPVSLPLPDKSATFRLLLAGNTVFLASLWIAIIVLIASYRRTGPPPLLVDVSPNSVTNIIQVLASVERTRATNDFLLHRSIDSLAAGFQSSSNVFQAQIAEIRNDLTNRTDKLLSVLSNRTEFLLQSLTSRIDTMLANRLRESKPVPTNAPAQSQPGP